MKQPKQYPMDGPSLTAQAKMQQPQKNRAWLRSYFKDSRNVTRPETRAVVNLR